MEGNLSWTLWGTENLLEAESSQAPLLSSEFAGLDGDIGNSPPWPIDDELEEDGISDVKELGSRSFLSFLFQAPPLLQVKNQLPGLVILVFW